MTEILRAVDQALEEDTQGKAPGTEARKSATEELALTLRELGLNLDRIAEPPADRFLSAYLAGDRALYAEYLLSRTGGHSDRIRQAANEDERFSGQVEKFLLLFEIELARAKAAGPAAHQALLASEAGKLYVLVKGALDGR
jgi:hypothetical protein